MPGIRTSRNSVPRVNPNPRPPNEPRYGLAQNQPAQHGGLSGNQAVSHGKNQHRRAPGPTPNGRPPGTGAAPAASPSPAGGFASPVDPRDSQYWRDLAQLNFNTNIGLQRLTTEGTYDKTNYERELANRAYLDPIETQRLREGANVGGTIYSTSTQEDLGNLAQQQFQQRAGLTDAYQRALSNRAFEESELKHGKEYGEGNLLQEAIERASGRETEREGPAEEYVSPTQEALRARTGRTKNRSKKPTNKKSSGAQRSHNVPTQNKKKRR